MRIAIGVAAVVMGWSVVAGAQVAEPVKPVKPVDPLHAWVGLKSPGDRTGPFCVASCYYYLYIRTIFLIR